MINNYGALVIFNAELEVPAGQRFVSIACSNGGTETFLTDLFSNSEYFLVYCVNLQHD